MRKLLTSLIAVLVISNIQAQQPSAPKLVVCITVDQLRGDYIEYFYNTFGEKGFKRLLNQGIVYNNIRFEFANVDEATSMATLFTGANPCFHGITGNRRFSFDNEKAVSCLNDPEYLGNYTSDHYSPRNLFSSTVGDELKIASKGRSDVYAIAPLAEQAILSAGHAANGAFWLDNTSGNWATTTYYKGMPWYVDRSNSGVEALPARIGATVWEPLMPLADYRAFPYLLDDLPFRYTFNPQAASCYTDFKTSPFINSEVTRLALQFVEYDGFGTRACPDMMSVTYYAGNYRLLADKEYTREIQDTYIRLDKDIATLLDTIDKKVGLANTLVVFTGTGYYRSEENYADGLAVSRGQFHPDRCVALLNMYLMAIYGQKSWVKGYYDNQIYLNRKAIEDDKLDLNEIQTKAADFVLEFSGVQHVTTDRRLRSGYWNENTADFRNGTHHLYRGDLIIELQPGWTIAEGKAKTQPNVIRNNAVITPLVFMGNGLRPQHIHREVKATEVAPTITHVLRIRPPNACKQTPLFELITH